MSELVSSRRGFLAGLGAFLVKAVDGWTIEETTNLLIERMNHNLYGDLVAVTRKAFVPRLYVQLYRDIPMVDYLAAGG